MSVSVQSSQQWYNRGWNDIASKNAYILYSALITAARSSRTTSQTWLCQNRQSTTSTSPITSNPSSSRKVARKGRNPVPGRSREKGDSLAMPCDASPRLATNKPPQSRTREPILRSGDQKNGQPACICSGRASGRIQPCFAIKACMHRVWGNAVCRWTRS